MLLMSSRAADTKNDRSRCIILFCRHTHTQTAMTCSYCGGFACSTKLAYSDESAHAFGRANRSETLHMVLRMPSAPDFCPFFSFLLLLWCCHHTADSSRPSLIRNRTAYLSDHISDAAAAIVTEVAVPGGPH